MAKNISINAIKKAEITHERTKNVKATIDMYCEIYKEGNDE